MKFVLLAFACWCAVAAARRRRAACAHRAVARRCVRAQDMLSCAHCGVHMRVMKPWPGRGGVFVATSTARLTRGASACHERAGRPRAIRSALARRFPMSAPGRQEGEYRSAQTRRFRMSTTERSDERRSAERRAGRRSGVADESWFGAFSDAIPSCAMTTAPPLASTRRRTSCTSTTRPSSAIRAEEPGRHALPAAAKPAAWSSRGRPRSNACIARSSRARAGSGWRS